MIRRCTNAAGIFPNQTTIIRLVGAVLAEKNDKWAVAGRYMAAETLEQTQAGQVETEENSPTFKQTAA